MPPFGAHPVALLDVGAVGEHHLREIDGGGGRIDRTAKAERPQARQQPAVVDVGMRQQHEIERLRIEAPVAPVQRARIGPALEHAAVDDEAGARCFEQETRSGDLARGAEKTHGEG